MSALLADLCGAAILAGIGYFVGGYWLGFTFGAGGIAAVVIALLNAREDADCDGAPTELGQWPFGKKED